MNHHPIGITHYEAHDAGGDATIVVNHDKDPSYSPYCMRCAGLQRMRVVEPFYWRHRCGAEHDERETVAVVLGARGRT